MRFSILISSAFVLTTSFSMAQGLIVNPLAEVYRPLDEIDVSCSGGSTLEVYDGMGRVYFTSRAPEEVSFRVGGALGYQQIVLKDKKGVELERATILVKARTGINDEGGKYAGLLNSLYWTMTANGGTRQARLDGRFYQFFVRWLRDHVHTLKGMKYFEEELKSGIDLYADFQREDGMIWDNIYPRNKQKNWWEKRFAYGGFYKSIEQGNYELKRIPVENDVEYLFIEGIYYTWKATGSDEWMKGMLDKALKAIRYSTTDEYRWSDKYQLLKRGYTIDTWDFQSHEDAMIAGGDIMVVYPDKTRFGIMFGDNTGMYAACNYLAGMLRYVGRNREASEIREFGSQLKQRIDKLSWTGRYYTHHVPEDPSVVRDLGVDEASQVSLSNAYSLNRGLTHKQCVAIIKTYQKIREEMPESSPGEWYTIYPPFEKGFGTMDSSDKWEYMNGGVTPIVAGELANGAFEHGYESYAVDILDRIEALASATDGYLHCAYRGAMPEPPVRNFEMVPLEKYVNIEYPPKAATSAGKSFYGETQNGMVNFQGIPFKVKDPDNGNTAIEISGTDQYGEVKINLNKKTQSLYFLHNRENVNVAGTITLEYEDGTTFTDYLTQDKIGFWWSEKLDNQFCKKAWRTDDMNYFVGLYVYGLNNPHPDKLINTLRLRSTGTNAVWRTVAISTSDYPVYFTPSMVSHGIPDNWGAAAVTLALIEGLVGVKDQGVAFNKALISPRWEAAGIQNANATVKYEASGGYVSYQFTRPSEDRIRLIFTGTSSHYGLRVLLPYGKNVKEAQLDGNKIETTTETIEYSEYAVAKVNGIKVHRLQLWLE